MSNQELYEIAKKIDLEIGKEFEEVSNYVFNHPELGLDEFESSKYLVSYLKEKGFEVTFPYMSFETAFRAEFGKEGPKVAFLAEYDALPGYGPEKNQNGHACGHNWIAASTVGAAVVLAKMSEELKCRAVLIGTPAEETYGTKSAMSDNGAFDDIDIVLQPHLSEQTSICPHALAMSSLLINFEGRPSHSSAAPWDGINALDAVQLTYAGINALRQHVKPDTRIHGIVTKGGLAANIVPQEAECLFYVRAAHRDYANTVIEKVKNIAKGAALMTGSKVNITEPELPLDDLINIPAMQKLADLHLTACGLKPTMTEEKAIEVAGSTDIGNVSHVCPTMYMEIGLKSPFPFMYHEQSALELANSKYAYDALHKIINSMVRISIDVVKDPKILETVKSEFKGLSKK